MKSLLKANLRKGTRIGFGSLKKASADLATTNRDR
jgi:hypothetical protein